MEFYVEQIKQKKTVITLPMMKCDDGRHFIELESFMVGIAKVDVKDISKHIKHIPKTYLKTVDKGNNKKVKYIDRLAIGMVASQFDNYELFKFTVSRTNNKLDKYFPMLFVESVNFINNRLNHIGILRNELGNAEKARNDMLHGNENLKDLTQKEKADFYDDLNQLQCERRKTKIQLDCLTTFKNFFDSHNIKSSELTDLYNSINGLMNLASKKIYNKRANTTEAKKFLGSQADK